MVANSSLGFEVYLDGEKVFESPVMDVNSPKQYISIDVTGKKELKLIVNDGGNGNGSDHADWADAKLIREI